MDYIILYNPLSKGGANIKNSNKLKKQIREEKLYCSDGIFIRYC